VPFVDAAELPAAPRAADVVVVGSGPVAAIAFGLVFGRLYLEHYSRLAA
jgi:hypothetical protein